MTHTVTPLRSYRAVLWPERVPASDVQRHADAGALPTIRLRAPSADWAAKTAAYLTGQHVFSVERIEPAAPATPEGGAA